MIKTALRRQSSSRRYLSAAWAALPASESSTYPRSAKSRCCCQIAGSGEAALPSINKQQQPCNNNRIQNPNLRSYVTAQQRLFSSTSVSTRSAIDNTPLDGPAGSALLTGLDVHTVIAEDDGHPLAVYTVETNSDYRSDDYNYEPQHQMQPRERIPLLLLHGRTWSSVPVYHLKGGGNSAQSSSSEEGGESRSLLQALYDTNHIQPYAMDFRGFGGTIKDESGFIEPLRCVSDIVSVLNWIHDKHNNECSEGGKGHRPALLGWSHGALLAQITAQRHPDTLSKLILYGSIYNPNVKYSIPTEDTPHTGHTDHDDFPVHEMASRNEYDGAMEDFTNVNDAEARIFPPISAKLFADVALVSDPIKAQWWNLHQLNECHPSLVRVPTMVIAGDQDPYAPLQTQGELFTNLSRGVDRVWSIVANGDHAIHLSDLSDERHRFVVNVDSFLATSSL